MLIHSTGPPPPSSTCLYVAKSEGIQNPSVTLPRHGTLVHHNSGTDQLTVPLSRSADSQLRFVIHHLLPPLPHIASSVSQSLLYLHALFHPSDFIITTIFQYLVTRCTLTPHMDISAHHPHHHRYAPRGIHGIFYSVYN